MTVNKGDYEDKKYFFPIDAFCALICIKPNIVNGYQWLQLWKTAKVTSNRSTMVTFMEEPFWCICGSPPDQQVELQIKYHHARGMAV